MKRLIVLAMFVVLTLAAFTLRPIEPDFAEKPQLASVLFWQGEDSAVVTLSVVDLGPMQRYDAKMFKNGVVIVDCCREFGISGDAVLLRQGQTWQAFALTHIKIVNKGKRIKIMHLFVGVVTGDRYHPTFVCSSPEGTIEACLAKWVRN